MTTPSAPPPPDERSDPDDERHPVLEAFNAEGVVEDPDHPQAEPGDTPADDAAAPPP